MATGSSKALEEIVQLVYDATNNRLKCTAV